MIGGKKYEWRQNRETVGDSASIYEELLKNHRHSLGLTDIS
jgi:hypothetical protein